MKKLNLFKNCAAVTTFFFLIASTSFAQLKLGNNPTTLGTNNNLEVEGTNSKKVAVKSDTGQLIVGSSNTSVPTGGANAAVIIDNGTTNGAIQIKDGNQATGKVLTSDANGLATWKPSGFSKIDGTNPNTPLPNISSSGTTYVGRSVTLPPGSYMIVWNCTYYTSQFCTAVWDLSDSTTYNLNGGRSLTSSGNGYLAGTFIYLVNTTVTKTYYMFGSLFGGSTASYSGEARLFAVPIN